MTVWDFIVDLFERLFDGAAGDAVPEPASRIGDSIFNGAVAVGGDTTPDGSIFSNAMPVPDAVPPALEPEPPSAETPTSASTKQPHFGMAMDGGVDQDGEPLTWSTADKAGGALYRGNEEVKEV